MLYDKDIARLKAQLLSLGFENGLESLLRSKLCFQPAQFCLKVRINKGSDVLDILLQFSLAADSVYECRYYDAVLRKNFSVASAAELDARMKLVDWNFSLTIPSEIFQQEEVIDSILTDLKKIAVNEDGRIEADILKYKYWSGTSIEYMVERLPVLKATYEVGQRFYFFTGEEPITLEEAYRFLCNRWMEKQVQARKKTKVPAGDDALTSPGGTEPITKKKELKIKGRKK